MSWRGGSRVAAVLSTQRLGGGGWMPSGGAARLWCVRTRCSNDINPISLPLSVVTSVHASHSLSKRPDRSRPSQLSTTQWPFIDPGKGRQHHAWSLRVTAGMANCSNRVLRASREPLRHAAAWPPRCTVARARAFPLTHICNCRIRGGKADAFACTESCSLRFGPSRSFAPAACPGLDLTRLSPCRPRPFL